MELSVSINENSLSVPLPDPFHADLDGIVKQIEALASANGFSMTGLDVKGLLQKMIRGVGGCESGCPANAMDFVRRGFSGFHLAYIEGGILTAANDDKKGKILRLKMFPDF